MITPDQLSKYYKEIKEEKLSKYLQESPLCDNAEHHSVVAHLLSAGYPLIDAMVCHDATDLHGLMMSKDMCKFVLDSCPRRYYNGDNKTINIVINYCIKHRYNDLYLAYDPIFYEECIECAMKSGNEVVFDHQMSCIFRPKDKVYDKKDVVFDYEFFLK